MNLDHFTAARATPAPMTTVVVVMTTIACTLALSFALAATFVALVVVCIGSYAKRLECDQSMMIITYIFRGYSRHSNTFNGLFESVNWFRIRIFDILKLIVRLNVNA